MNWWQAIPLVKVSTDNILSFHWRFECNGIVSEAGLVRFYRDAFQLKLVRLRYFKYTGLMEMIQGIAGGWGAGGRLAILYFPSF